MRDHKKNIVRSAAMLIAASNPATRTMIPSLNMEWLTCLVLLVANPGHGQLLAQRGGGRSDLSWERQSNCFSRYDALFVCGNNSNSDARSAR